ncbi:MAG: bifunctional 5,10-methylenetetrahydrofolate dehydrogenase/5,10-methenyltetrahydrofolate cyclohydrolase [Candidatus Omnitrophica bacterium]|nr:bifunctional 5,10-methylenetetrahydrofolate dehydrogenase/5,10-methenyltetrahydrofolate cyclohydrolase [Candidatus Omnitrophota bacterium]MBU0881462.1 bifunctional 5,10-methylenetetrahydrofolate dehydrogenase/5,10-methenyltetrahydrofolate cyclohydrolase [Candidatus Omnitrophota bacterium]MBU0895317.1 bifunctional 5,10-methylenetetrahydrofolate dehydrogenase/5,10-methenyltetrahydrofolate cyclohydrolase [Candidatus Omnitrophota bacterium]MBU1809030.1 bifunctional 5,10-methylenetetrahydrofolate 
MATLLKGKPLADKIKVAITQEVTELVARYGRAPKLVAIQALENAASSVYIKNQKKVAESLGIEYELMEFPAGISQSELEKVIKRLNSDKSVTAMILQLPLPGQIDAGRALSVISPDKDAEGMHPQNVGKILLGKYSIGPCTAMAVMELLASTGVDLYGKEAVIVGHSEIAGKPLGLMLLNKFATTTVCHIATDKRGALADHVRRAEVLIVAVGKASLIKGDWVRDQAIVIDVGINKVGERIVGDVEFEGASAKASQITPVPGGVGPLTTTMLMRNTVEQFKAQLAGIE